MPVTFDIYFSKFIFYMKIFYIVIYINDVIFAGIFDVGRLITDTILWHLIFLLLLTSLRIEAVNVVSIGDLWALMTLSSSYWHLFLSCIL